MEDLTFIMPVTTEIDELSCPDEEMYDDSESFVAESRESFLSESIFCTGTLSSLPLTQAV